MLLLSIIVAASCSLILLLGQKEKGFEHERYFAAIVEKHRRLESTAPPRIILVGGSNVAFGIDSRRMEMELGVPVVNMSLSVTLGMPFMLNEVQQSVRLGDIVILSFEYDITSLLTGTWPYLRHVVQVFPESTRFLDVPYGFHPRLVFHLNNIKFEATKSVQQIQQILSRGITNEPVKKAEEIPSDDRLLWDYNDWVLHLGKAQKKMFLWSRLTTQDYGRFIKRINEFVQNTKSRGAIVYFMFPPFNLSNFRVNQPEILKYHRTCLAKLDADILNTPEMFAFPDDYFYEPGYHLNRTGRELRTSITMELLKEKMGKQRRSGSRLLQ